MSAGTIATLPGAGVDLEALVFAGPSRPRGMVILLHGWGGSAETLRRPAAELAEAGFLSVSVSMRGWGRSGGVDDCGLQQPDDVTAAIEQLQRLHPDGGRVGLVGISQGGQVALLCAARGAPVACVAAWAPVTDVERWRETTETPGIPAYIDAACADGALAARSPLAQVERLDVPVLLVHGDADTRVPTAQSVLLHDELRRHGRSCRLELLAGVGHQRGPAGNERAMRVTVEFLREHLLAP